MEGFKIVIRKLKSYDTKQTNTCLIRYIKYKYANASCDLIDRCYHHGKLINKVTKTKYRSHKGEIYLKGFTENKLWTKNKQDIK